MSFFEKYNGTTDRGLQRLERALWALIYGGLLALVLGIFIGRGADADPRGWYIGGALALATGLLLFLLRARRRDQ